MRRRLVVRGVMTAGVGSRGVMSRFRGMFLGLAGCVRFVVRRGFRLLRPSRNRGNNSKTKQDQDNPRSPRNLSEKAETIERPWNTPMRHNQSKKLHISINLAV